MATVVRLKRHRGIDPLYAVIISCKNLKANEFPYNYTVLRYQETVTSELEFVKQVTECIRKHLTFCTYQRFSEINAAPYKDCNKNRLIFTDCFRASDIMPIPYVDFTILDVEYEYQDESEQFYIYDIFYTHQMVGDFKVDLINQILQGHGSPPSSDSESSDECVETNTEFAYYLSDYSDSYSDSDDDDEDELVEGLATCQLVEAEESVSTDEGSVAEELGPYKMYGRVHSYVRCSAFTTAHERNDYCIGVDSDDNDDNLRRCPIYVEESSEESSDELPALSLINSI